MGDRYAPHVAEIRMALGDKVGESVILEDLEKLVKYRVPLEEAKRSIIKKHGGTGSVRKSLSELTPNDRMLEITVKILSVSKRDVDVRGVKRRILSGILGDGTGQVPFIAWKEFDLKKNDVVGIKGAYVRLWQSQLQVNLGERCEITKDVGEIPEIDAEILPTRLADVKAHMSNLCVVGVVLEARKEVVSMKDGDGERTIIDGVLADESGKLRFTSWIEDERITPRKTLRIENVYVKPFRGVPTINISEEASISLHEEEITPIDGALHCSISELLKRDGALDVIVEGNVVSVRSGSGLIRRCPDCSRVIQNNTCRVHGEVSPVTDMRVKSVIDDGTGSIMLVLSSELTETLWGHTLREAEEMASKRAPDSVERDIRESLTGKRITARGNMNNGEYGASLVAESVSFVKRDVKEEAIKLLKERGVHENA
ncbi:hypothetical protein AIOGIFDO_00566 [Candidatus Methanoperedenaceae archaeon GB37]|nr:hypothetical protein AIOGIFDO_00566 [Candidatus Methanoperedenaceae archaeon GB37]